MRSKRPINAQESFQDLHFPLAGIDLSSGFDRQPNRPVGTGDYARTTPLGINVRAFEPQSSRARGGIRPGLTKYLPAQAGSGLIQILATIVGEGYKPPGGNVQSSQSGRIVTLVAVSQGVVKVANAGDTVWTSVTNNTLYNPGLNATGLIMSAVNNQKLWFADGSNWAVYIPATNSLEIWNANASTGSILPVDSAGNKPRLICTWRGRTVLSGLLLDAQNWFMSAVSDPTDFNYSPYAPTPTQAVAGNNSQLGLVGDVITALIPYTDDTLIFGGDHTLWMMAGDPMAGGQLGLISDAIGVAWGQAWCKDPYGTVYFVSNRTGIYTLTPGAGPPQRISQGIEQLLTPIDTGANTIRLIWDDRFQGLHVFITPTATAAATTHFFWEQRVNAWWQDQFSNNNHNPQATCVFDGNSPTDRVSLIGSWDGYVRYMDANATTDDGTPIASSIVIGPLVTQNLDDVLLKDLQAVLGQTSGSVTYAVYVGASAEIAFNSAPVQTGTWLAGRNLSNFVRRSGHAIYVKITSTNAWAMETIRARIQTSGKVRRRGY